MTISEPTMQLKMKCAGPGTAARGNAWLKIRIHMDAARLAPRSWFKALWWRLQGKRVRSRAQFAPLLAASPYAYHRWLLDEPTPELFCGDGSADIVAIVDAGLKQEETLVSLAAQGVSALLIGTPDIPDLRALVEKIDWSLKPWLMPLPAGDVLAKNAIAAYRAAAAQTNERIIYADDDIIDAAGRRSTPHFKPKWNSELFRYFDYLSGACIVRATRDDFAGLSQIKLSGSHWATKLISAVSDQGEPLRLPHVLHHRQSRPIPHVPSLNEAKYETSEAMPRVSVIVPTRNRLELLETCLEGLDRTDYPNFEVIVVDNGSDDLATLAYLGNLNPARYRVLRYPGPFNFSALNNHAAKLATGELLCLLNNDIEVLDPRWLTTMVRQSLRPEVGAVGAQLLYPNGRIQHAGVVMGICGAAAHAHRFLLPHEEGYFRRHALPQFVSAVTAAAFVVRRDCYEAIGGMDEKKFPVAFNDVDLCLRLNARGWQTLYEPRATLIHHESVSRGLDRDPVGAARFASELAALKAAWGTDSGPAEEIDPYHHPQLNPFCEHFVIRL
jgi:GT2 family glycosyltransferase